MADSERRQRGLAKYNEVYCGDLPVPPSGALDFFDLMLEHVFAELWTRPQLSQRDRRIFTMGIIAALGEQATFEIQARSAVKNGELTPDQLRELVIHGAPYAGYPRVAGLVTLVEKVLAELKQAEG